MKKLLLLVALLWATTSGIVRAHPEHDRFEINGKGASSIALRTIKQLTDKDLGFEVSQLGPNWKNTSMQDISVEKYKMDHYVIKAKPEDVAKAIYLKIMKTGQVVEVSDNPEW